MRVKPPWPHIRDPQPGPDHKQNGSPFGSHEVLSEPIQASDQSGRPDLNRRPLDPRTGQYAPSQLRGFSLPDTTGGHLRVVLSHGYRVVPVWSPREDEKRHYLVSGLT
jgi:hypothetical protein